MSDCKYIHIEDGKENFTEAPPIKPYHLFQTELEADPNVGLVKKFGALWRKNLTLPFAPPHDTLEDLPEGLGRSSFPNPPHVLDRSFHRQTVLAPLSCPRAHNLGLHLALD